MIPTIKRRFEWKEPSIIAEELVKRWGEDGLIWLDGDSSTLGRWGTLAVDPIAQICCRGLPTESKSTNPFDALRNLEPGLWTGWLSYEAGAWIEPQNPWKEDSMATLWIARHDPILKFDLYQQQLWIEGSDITRFEKLANWISTIQPKEKY